ncbi:MAG: MFS transporter [Dehalococcoidales bacterium]|nr:MFS transporter [Dehalococcoidales bacterium]
MKNDSPFEADAPRYPWIGKRPFYGWIIVIVGAVTQFFQGIASQGFSSYMDLLQTEFGWTKAMLSGPRSITSIEGAITGPIEGILVDKFGPRKVVIAGLLISVLGYIIFGLTNNYIMYYVASMAITLGIGFQGLLVMSVTVNNWFNRKRTMAQAIMGLGYSMAGVIGVPLLVILQNNLGWRESCFITAAAVLVIGLPFAFLLKDSPESIGEVPDGKQTARAIPDK